MKAVIDTNVLVSGLIKQGTPPAEVLSDLVSGVLVVLYDQRILEEYRDVLARPRLPSARSCVAAVELSVWCHVGTRPNWNSAAWTPRLIAAIDSDCQAHRG